MLFTAKAPSLLRLYDPLYTVSKDLNIEVE